MKKLLLVAAFSLLPSFALAQSPVLPYTAGTPVTALNPLPVTPIVGGTPQNVNITQILGAAPSATNQLWISPATASTPWISSISTWAGGILGAMANYGTSPGAVLVPGVNAFVTNPLPAGTNIIGGVGASKHLVSSTLTKISGAGTYGGTTTAPQAMCLFASVTVCAPLTLTVSSVNTVNGVMPGLQLVKSTTGATAATFRLFAFQAAPTLTGIFNGSTYLVPLADITSGAFVGSWECATQVVNSDNSFYDCTANRPIGVNSFNLTDATLRFIVTTTGAYVSGSSETFNVIADLLTSVP